MSKATTAPSAGQVRKSKRVQGLYQERVDDSYRTKGKLPEPTLCRQCGAVYHKGHWQWLARPDEAHSALCPACHRIKDAMPAGFVNIAGAFFDQHRDEIVQLVRHRADKENADHPLGRIMHIENHADGIQVTTTDVHLARGIGEALRHAYQGALRFRYNEAENLLRVYWRR